MLEFVGFQTMGILVPYGITFDAVGVFGQAFHLLFKSCSTYCATCINVNKQSSQTDTLILFLFNMERN